MRSHWIRINPKPYHWGPCEKSRRATGIQAEEACEDRERLELCHRKPRNTTVCPSHQKLEEARENSSLEPSGGAASAHTLILDLWPPEQCENKFSVVFSL